MATVYPQTKVGPLEIQGTRVVDSNTFSAGVFVALTASGWVLADNSSRSKLASGWVAAADPDSFRVVTSSGQVVEWYGHGLGSAGDLLWLSTGGAATTTEPSGSSVALSQVIGKILDANHVQVFPAARSFGDALYLGAAAGADGAIYANPAMDGTASIGGVLYVDESTGRVGINTASPETSLHVAGGDIRIDAGKRYYISTDVSIARHVAGQGLTLRQEGSTFFRLSAMRTDGATGNQALAIFRAEAISDLANSYDGGGMQVQQIDSTDGAEKTQLKFFTCQGGASPAEALRLNQLNTVAVLQDLAVNAASGSYGGGVGVIFVADRTTAPTSPPTGGSVLYSEGGRLMVREDNNRFVVQAVTATKTTAAAPYTNDGYVTVEIGGTSVKLMTTA